MPEKLRFYSRGTASLPCPHGADAEPQRRRIVGKTHQQVSPGTWGWVPSAEPDVLDYHHDLVKAVKDGDLWAADEHTAKVCGVKFDPTFGGERDDAPATSGDKPADAPATDSDDAPASSGGKGDV